MDEANKISDIISNTISELSKHDYKKSYIKHHRFIFNAFQRFCEDSKIKCYSETVGQHFLEWIKEQKPTLKHHTMNEYRMAVRRLNCTLLEVEWSPFKNKAVPYAKSCFDDIVIAYEKYLFQKGKTKEDTRAHIHIVARFLKSVEQQGVLSLSTLSQKVIYSLFQSATNKTSYGGAISTFLRYAYKYGFLNSNLGLIVPRVYFHTHVPTVYSPKEIEQLISSIGRKTEKEKRNYAVVLLGARLGLRACDIAGLKWNNLHLDTSTIEIIQVKTKQSLTLPFLDEVKIAIYDYANNGRPNSLDEYVFLNLRGYGSLSPQTVSTTVRRLFEKSEIELCSRPHGSHALRSSLASALLTEGNDFLTIQKVLGHRDIQSTKAYVRADVENLRPNALSVPAPTVHYEELLAAVGGEI